MADDGLSEIVPKLKEIFNNDAETFARVLFYLGQEIETYKDSEDKGPMMKILISCTECPSLFKSYAFRLAEDTRRADNNERFKRNLSLIYAQLLDAKGHKEDEDNQLVPLEVQLQRMIISSSTGIARAMSVIRASEGVVARVGGLSAAGYLSGVVLTYEAIMNIRRWWKGEISGKRCCKNVVDSAALVGGSLGGGWVGAAIGAPLGPVGMLAGGLVGGIIGGEAARALCDVLTRTIFDLPKSEALENAYKFFSLNRNASNEQINKAYRMMCLEHHPDKGGSSEKFHLVQVNLAVIKAAKGQL